MNKVIKREETSYSSLIIFTLPCLFSTLLEPFAGIVDTALVGNKNTVWLASLAIGVTVMSSFTWIFNFLLHVSTQSVSEFFGKLKYQQSNDVQKTLVERFQLSLCFALVVGIVSTILLFILKDFIYSIAAVDESIEAYVDEYFLIRLFGQPLVILYSTALALMRGLSCVKESFLIVAVTTFINIILSWTLLFVFDLGLYGVAIGTVVSHTIGLIVCLITTVINYPFLKMIFLQKPLAPQDEWFRFGKNSFDLFGRSLFLTFSLFLAMRGAAQIGHLQLAAHQILLQFWLLASFITDGIAITANILGAKFKGSQRQRDLIILSKRLLVMGLVAGGFFSLTYAAGYKVLPLLFTSDKDVMFILYGVWPLLVASQLINAIAFVLDGILFGLERFDYLRTHMMIGFFFIFLPVWGISQFYSAFLTLWLALVLLNCYRGVSGLWMIKTTLWKRSEASS